MKIALIALLATLSITVSAKVSFPVDVINSKLTDDAAIVEVGFGRICNDLGVACLSYKQKFVKELRCDSSDGIVKADMKISREVNVEPGQTIVAKYATEKIKIKFENLCDGVTVESLEVNGTKIL